MVKWDSVLINGKKITITVNGVKYNGKFNGDYYWMQHHEKSCEALSGNIHDSIREKINDIFKTGLGHFPVSSDPTQFVKDYFTMNNTGKGKFINTNDEF